MKNKILLLFTLLTYSYAHGQSDSIKVATKVWNEVKFGKGLTWKQGHFPNLFDSEQEINFIEIHLKKNRKRIKLAADSKTLKTTEAFAIENQALVAINGGFFDIKNGGAVDYIKVDGQVINHTKAPSDRANAVLVLTKKAANILPLSANLPEADNVMLSGPLLLQHAELVKLSKSAFNDNRHPRSALALQRNKKMILLVVDGRNKLAEGMSLPELGKVLSWLGATEAMNVDGGGSSTLYIDGKGVVNYPSDNKKFDHQGQRPVANIVYLKKQ
jgi:exopolysaccharide biosynthesis protein